MKKLLLSGVAIIALVAHSVSAAPLPYSNAIPTLPSFQTTDVILNMDFRNAAANPSAWPITVARTGNNSVIQWDANGTAQGSANNTARLTYDKDTQDNLGLWIEGSATNVLQSSTFTGATTGVVGSGGALPTNWAAFGTSLVVNVLAASSSSMTVEFSRASGSVASGGLYTGGTTQASYASTSGDVWTWSMQMQLNAVASGSVVPQLAFARRNSGGTLQAFDGAVNPHALQTDKLFTEELTFQNTTTGFYIPAFWFTMPAGAFDFTVTFAQPQDELSAFRTSYIPNATTSTTRPADVITVNGPTAYISRPNWTLYTLARAPQGNISSGTLWEMNGGTAANRLTVALANYQLQATVCAASACTTTNLGYMIPLTEGELTVSFNSGNATVSYNHTAAVTLTGIPYTAFTAWQLGNGQSGYWQDTIGKITAWGKSYPAAGVVSYTTTADMYDDFNRANGAIGIAPTGQQWVQSQAYQNNVISLSAITGGMLTTGASGQNQTYGYNNFSLGSSNLIKAQGAAFIEPTTGGSGQTTSTITLIQTPAGAQGLVTQITTTPSTSHPITSYAAVTPEYWQGGSVFNTTGVLNTANLPKDTVGFTTARVAGNAQITRNTEGRLVRYANPIFTLAQSPNGVLEVGYQTADIAPQVVAFKADARPAPPTVPYVPQTGLFGTTTNDKALTGNLGEYPSASLASGSAISLTTATPANVTSVALTAGDWDCRGTADYVLSSATSTLFQSGINTTSATFGGQDTSVTTPLTTTLLSATNSQPTPIVRLSLAASATAYLIADATFSAGTQTAYGSLSCRRAR